MRPHHRNAEVSESLEMEAPLTSGFTSGFGASQPGLGGGFSLPTPASVKAAFSSAFDFGSTPRIVSAYGTTRRGGMNIGCGGGGGREKRPQSRGRSSDARPARWSEVVAEEPRALIRVRRPRRRPDCSIRAGAPLWRGRSPPPRARCVLLPSIPSEPFGPLSPRRQLTGADCAPHNMDYNPTRWP